MDAVVLGPVERVVGVVIFAKELSVLHGAQLLLEEDLVQLLLPPSKLFMPLALNLPLPLHLDLVQLPQLLIQV